MFSQSTSKIILIILFCSINFLYLYSGKLFAQPTTQDELDNRIMELIRQTQYVDTVVMGRHIFNSKLCFDHISENKNAYIKYMNVANYFVGYSEVKNYERYYFEPRPIAITEQDPEWEAVVQGRRRPWYRGKGAIIRCKIDPMQHSVMEIEISPQ